MRGSVTLGHVRGIPIRAHFTLLFILPYLAYVMAVRFEAVARQAGVVGQSMVLPPAMWGILLAVALFACVLLHELGHSLLALRYGGRVSSITLMLLGGVSELKGMPRTPRNEALVAAAGPFVSFVLGGIALALYRLVPTAFPDVRFGLFYIGEINLALAIFNILPAFPMDGGRVLRAVLSAHWSRLRATQIAAATGTAFAGLFVVFGLFSGNILLALIGLFVWSGARAETEMVVQDELVRGLTVRDVMIPASEVLQATEPATRAAARMAVTHATALPVVENGDLVGVLAAHHLETLKPEERDRTPVAALVDREAPRLDADDPLPAALERMAEKRTEEAPVLHQDHIVGILDVSDLGRLVRLRRLAQEGATVTPIHRPAPAGSTGR
jgi:Zn-dependent protease/predicted transcriptional regulator